MDTMCIKSKTTLRLNAPILPCSIRYIKQNATVLKSAVLYHDNNAPQIPDNIVCTGANILGHATTSLPNRRRL